MHLNIVWQLKIPYKSELNDLRIIIYSRKSEVSVEKISACSVTGNVG